MRIFFLFLFLLLEHNSFSQKKLDNIITNNSYGLRLEVKNFFVSTDRFKIQEIKPFYNINDKFKLGFGFCFLREKSFNTHDFDYELYINGTQDMRPSVFDFAHDNGLKILNLQFKNESLEQLFKKLTA